MPPISFENQSLSSKTFQLRNYTCMLFLSKPTAITDNIDILTMLSLRKSLCDTKVIPRRSEAESVETRTPGRHCTCKRNIRITVLFCTENRGPYAILYFLTFVINNSYSIHMMTGDRAEASNHRFFRGDLCVESKFLTQYRLQLHICSSHEL